MNVERGKRESTRRATGRVVLFSRGDLPTPLPGMGWLGSLLTCSVTNKDQKVITVAATGVLALLSSGNVTRDVRGLVGLV